MSIYSEKSAPFQTVLCETQQVFFNHACAATHERIIGKREAHVTQPGHHAPLFRQRVYQGPSVEEQALLGQSDALDRYVAELKKRSHGRGVRRLRRLLFLKQTYPPQPFCAALNKALAYGLFDLGRLESMILDRVAGDFFLIPGDYD